jgi:hypothetical protein
MPIPYEGLSGLEVADINVAATDPVTSQVIYTPDRGKRWVCFVFEIENTDVTNASTYQWESEGVAISGAMTLAQHASANTLTRVFRHNGGEMLLIGNAIDDRFQITKTGTGLVDGWALMGSIL